MAVGVLQLCMEYQSYSCVWNTSSTLCTRSVGEITHLCIATGPQRLRQLGCRGVPVQHDLHTCPSNSHGHVRPVPPHPFEAPSCRLARPTTNRAARLPAQPFPVSRAAPPPRREHARFAIQAPHFARGLRGEDPSYARNDAPPIRVPRGAGRGVRLWGG